MAAEAQAENPVPPPPPAARGISTSASPEKRALPVPETDASSVEEEERQQLPEPKRRRASVAALDSVPPAVAAEGEEAGGAVPGPDADGGASFSFQHARGGFVAPEATPKFGSFNPPGDDAEQAGLDLKLAEPGAGGEGSLEADGEAPSASARGAEDKDEDGQLLVGGEVDG